MTVAEDGSITFTVLGNDSDAEGDPLTVGLREPAHPRHIAPQRERHLHPYADGQPEQVDSFTYVLNDGNLDSNVATVHITVSPVADAPTLVLTSQPGQTWEVFRTGWESAANTTASNATLVAQSVFEGWTLITTPDSYAGESTVSRSGAPATPCSMPTAD